MKHTGKEAWDRLYSNFSNFYRVCTPQSKSVNSVHKVLQLLMFADGPPTGALPLDPSGGLPFPRLLG